MCHRNYDIKQYTKADTYVWDLPDLRDWYNNPKGADATAESGDIASSVGPKHSSGSGFGNYKEQFTPGCECSTAVCKPLTDIWCRYGASFWAG